MISATIDIHFCAAHRLAAHPGKCSQIHGHNYKAEITVSAEQLDCNGMVIDFSEIKSSIGNWIDQHFDHAFIYDRFDERIANWLKAEDWKRFEFTKPPTAEHIALHLLSVCRYELGLETSRIVLWETPSARVEVS